MIEIRPVRADDLEALYRIALATGDGGADAGALYRDPKLLGHLYAAPYALLCPDTVFVVEDAGCVGGYIVGTADTAAFEARLEAAWWPPLRAVYPDPPAAARDRWSLDQRRCYAIHHPVRAPVRVSAGYPSHLHINLLPELRGRGIGRRLLERWIDAVRATGSHGAHLAVGVTNVRAVGFYMGCGFRRLDDEVHSGKGAVWMGVTFDGGLVG